MSATTTHRQDAEAATGAGFTAKSQILAFVEFLLLGGWLGAMCFFSFAVAPSAFAVLPSRHLAGQMVASTITKVEWLGLIIGFLLLLMQFLKTRKSKLNIALLAGMLAATAGLRFWVSPTMNKLRDKMGGIIDEVSPTDPLRVQFNDLHQYSVTLMSLAILCGLALMFFTVRSWFRQVTR
ncbi:MAG: DUF4149 domain-containing protein [Acidobacteriota bacterium]